MYSIFYTLSNDKILGHIIVCIPFYFAKCLLVWVQILPPPISRTDFDKVLARQRPTVSKSDLAVHERFTKEFGEEG